ncbi:MAG TPA: family 16 glycoside hydrolase [Prolixibacteraceae bacterium]|nr:family 16 glycoside hydrolase [Prolixibacteraceae bacterium]
MHPRKLILVCLISASFLGYSQTTKNVSLTINTDKVIGKIDSKIYGQLLEHIYHSINGGLWGEMIATRSFEPIAFNGWYIDENELISPGTRTAELAVGNPEWTDYDATLEVKWDPYFVGVPAPWSGGQSDIRFVLRGNKESEGAFAFHFDAKADTVFKMEKNVKKNDSKLGWIVVQTNKDVPVKSLNPKNWHKVRIHCEGSAAQLFWDNKLIFDFKEMNSEIGKGSLTLLLSRTGGRFRNIQIKSLNGSILFSGIPEKLLPPSVAPDWKSFGPGTFQLAKDDAKNRYYSQKITAGTEETGVCQGSMNLHRNEIYRGSVWAKGDGKALLTVNFNKNQHKIAEQRLGIPGKDWKEYMFELRPSESTGQAVFALVVSGGIVYVDQVSMMADSTRKNGGYRPDLYEAAAGISPTVLRWPGGSFASGYNWKWGIGPQVNRIRMPKASWDDYEQNAFGTDEFIDLCRKMKSEPVIVIPIGYDQSDSERPRLIREAQEWLAYCNEPASGKWGKLRAQNGHPKPYNVKYWEIDNEMWKMGVEKYGQLLREFVPALKEIDSSIKIIACGDFTERKVYLDSVLLFSSGKYFDYLSLHHYESPNNYTSGPLNSAKKYANVARLIEKSPNSNIKIYVSEWNASELDMRTGLYAAGILNIFEKEPAIEIAAGALFLRRTDASGWNNSFINFDYKSWFPAPNYVVTKLWREHFAPNRLEINGNIDSLNVVATKSDDGKMVYLKTVNPTDQPITVKLTIDEIFPVSTVTFEVISANSLSIKNSMDQPDLIKPVYSDVSNEKNKITFTLPIWSASVVSIQRK